jgi:hypothetical protein
MTTLFTTRHALSSGSWTDITTAEHNGHRFLHTFRITDLETLRQGLPVGTVNKLLGEHLYELWKRDKPFKGMGIVEKTAAQVVALSELGHTSAAKFIAEKEREKVGTIHNRLRLARERDIIKRSSAGHRLSEYV